MTATTLYRETCRCGCLDCRCDTWDWEAADWEPPPPGRPVETVRTRGSAL